LQSYFIAQSTIFTRLELTDTRLALIVPYTAFRSLAAEQEDNTYDLLSITTLTSRQIVTGKLCSAIMQMLVYLSAVTPCIAFTFLLRGVDALTTVILFVVAVLGSLGLSMASLFIGAASRAKHIQIVTSVALVLWLFGAFCAAVGFAVELTLDGSVPRDAEVWVASAILGAVYATTFGLLHAAAAAQISFSSENRSSPVRRWMMAQQACFVGGMAGMAYAFMRDWAGLREVVTTCVLAGACYWAVMGALMTAEWPHLSRRVQRSLPQSTLGRTFLSFFNPGPGAGYMFAVSNLSALALAGLSLMALAPSPLNGWLSQDDAFAAVILAWAYVVGYLGLGRFLIGALRRWMYVSLTAGALLHVVLVMAGVGVPMTIRMTSRVLQRSNEYTLLQMSNPFWTVSELLGHRSGSVATPVLLVVIPAFAVAMLLLNMRSVAVELRRQRVAMPLRVAEEEAELHPAPAPGPQSPWDAEASGP
ncbi:MAG TPA: hypothetical protein VEQ85_04505, partial [Lacipirellulaceae bacterium]|nr:hypothetical protein [Lacipirellulaceae bacterium]